MAFSLNQSQKYYENGSIALWMASERIFNFQKQLNLILPNQSLTRRSKRALRESSSQLKKQSVNAEIANGSTSPIGSIYI